MTIFLLAFEFFKTGLFAVGGGMATLPFLMEMTEKYDWFSMDDLMNMVAIAESTPGPIGVNMATYAGYHAAGIPGAFTATFFLVLPSFLVILIIAGFLKRFKDSKYVTGAFYGIRPGVTALLLVVVMQLMGNILFTKDADSGFINTLAAGTLHVKWGSFALLALAFLCMQFRQAQKIHPILWILMGAFLGILFQL